MYKYFIGTRRGRGKREQIINSFHRERVILLLSPRFARKIFGENAARRMTIISLPSASMTQNNTRSLSQAPRLRVCARVHLHIITISIWRHVNAVVAVLAVYSRAHLRLPLACLYAQLRHPAIVRSPSRSFVPCHQAPFSFPPS